MYEVTLKDLGRIKDFALRDFHKLRQTNEFTNTELQQFLIISGLFAFLKGKGVEPGFTVEDLNHKAEMDNYETLEDVE